MFRGDVLKRLRRRCLISPKGEGGGGEGRGGTGGEGGRVWGMGEGGGGGLQAGKDGEGFGGFKEGKGVCEGAWCAGVRCEGDSRQPSLPLS